jgi:hypothetical protein
MPRFGEENIVMKTRPIFLSTSRFQFIVLIGIVFFSINIHAQNTQTFVVAAPSDSPALIKDDVDNFISFSPVNVEGKVYLRWMVRNDRKDGVYIIERSDDGTNFESLGFKDRVGSDKNIKLFYSWIDVAPPAEEAHYRIMQVGVDRTYTYSDVVRVKTGAAPTVGGNAINK